MSGWLQRQILHIRTRRIQPLRNNQQKPSWRLTPQKTYKQQSIRGKEEKEEGWRETSPLLDDKNLSTLISDLTSLFYAAFEPSEMLSLTVEMQLYTSNSDFVVLLPASFSQRQHFFRSSGTCCFIVLLETYRLAIPKLTVSLFSKTFKRLHISRHTIQ